MSYEPRGWGARVWHDMASRVILTGRGRYLAFRMTPALWNSFGPTLEERRACWLAGQHAQVDIRPPVPSKDEADEELLQLLEELRALAQMRRSEPLEPSLPLRVLRAHCEELEAENKSLSDRGNRLAAECQDLQAKLAQLGERLPDGTCCDPRFVTRNEDGSVRTLTVTFNEYQLSNLLWLLCDLVGYDAPGGGVEPFTFANTGDWNGEIPNALRMIGGAIVDMVRPKHPPNSSVESIRERISRWRQSPERTVATCFDCEPSRVATGSAQMLSKPAPNCRLCGKPCAGGYWSDVEKTP